MQSAILPGYPAYGIHANHMVSHTLIGAIRALISPGHDQV